MRSGLLQVKWAGMVLRDHHGTVIVAAARQLTNCTDALDAELASIEEGLALTLNWTSMNLTMETDCVEAVELIKQTSPNTTIYGSRIQEIREMLREREIRIAKVYREANLVSHELAKLGRVQHRTESWFQTYPQEIAEGIVSDCNSMNI
ncbi:hypothetical protein QYE76_059866 [Lolium multiflorum]|uniref:RNase H type-1 domain-containing protein n=1 Tax=Lolium multiflorum TaxID=4521 RepID=A0AAD8W399_LOLMU|nr:hypothetical protein QYE76_059866 [Lolium multiflorum]